MLRHKLEVDITLTPVELAVEFAAMSSKDQAIFFNELASLTKEWSRPFCFQLQAIIDDPALNKDGKCLMQDIGDYGSAAATST